MNAQHTPSGETLLECSGFSVASFDFPAFVARRGEITRLTFQENSFEASAARDALLARMAAAAQGADPEIRSHTGIVVAQPAVPYRRLSTLFRRQSLSYWLRRTTGRSEEDVATQLASAELEPDLLIWHAAGNPRTALGILQALSSSAKTIVFCTSGMCDPTGVRRILRLVHAQLGDRCGIYVSTPVDWRWPEFCFAADIAITRRAQTTDRRAAG